MWNFFFCSCSDFVRKKNKLYPSFACHINTIIITYVDKKRQKRPFSSKQNVTVTKYKFLIVIRVTKAPKFSHTHWNSALVICDVCKWKLFEFFTLSLFYDDASKTFLSHTHTCKNIIVEHSRWFCKWHMIFNFHAFINTKHVFWHGTETAQKKCKINEYSIQIFFQF